MSESLILTAIIGTGIIVVCTAAGRLMGIRHKQRQYSIQMGNRDSILEAVRFAATEFLMADQWESRIAPVLIRLHEATQASRINLFQRLSYPDGSQISRYRFGYPPDSDEDKVLIAAIKPSDIYPKALDRLLSGESVTLTPSEMSGSLLALVQKRDAKSALITPIMVAGEAWGTLTLTGMDGAPWPVAEREALHAAADILGAAIQRQHDAEALIKRERILEAVSFAARQFLRSSDWEQDIQSVLAELGMATKVSRVYIFSIDTDDDNTAWATIRFSWTAEGISSQLSNPNLQRYPFSDYLPSIYKHLRQREVVYGIVSDMPDEEKRAFRTTDILSILIVPIIVANKFWGVIGFDECSYPRVWSSAEREALKAAAEIIGGGIQRNEQDRMLREKTEELTERNRDLEAFNHTIAHDLRSPLHSITNALKMLRQRYVTELSQEIIETLVSIEIRTSQLNEMIDQLWWLTRLHDPSQEVTPVEIDLAIHSALVRYADRIKERGITINVSDTMPLAIGHWRWVVEVFANLISNAIKFFDDANSTPTIDITAVVKDDMVRYVVKDNGIGISPENQEKIFEMFERLDKSHSTGSGLGLSLVKRMVNKMGGQVGVESTLDKGTSIWFTLPACPPTYLI